MYKQQPNSNVFFLSDVSSLKVDIQSKWNNLDFKICYSDYDQYDDTSIINIFYDHIYLKLS